METGKGSFGEKKGRKKGVLGSNLPFSSLFSPSNSLKSDEGDIKYVKMYSFLSFHPVEIYVR